MHRDTQCGKGYHQFIFSPHLNEDASIATQYFNVTAEIFILCPGNIKISIILRTPPQSLNHFAKREERLTTSQAGGTEGIHETPLEVSLKTRIIAYLKYGIRLPGIVF